MKLIPTIILLFLSAICFAQTDSTKGFSFFGYVEGYYINNLNTKKNDERPAFFSNHTRVDKPNIPNINLALAKVSYNAPQLRANAGVMLGTYPVYGLAPEPVVVDRIYELNAGLKLGTKKDIWLDVGILRSHIGFETIIGKDQPNLTRSILAETSPYYETGARLSYTSNNKKLYLAALALNGWQRIATKEDKGAVGTGIQLTITPNSKFSFNYSNYIGNGTATKKLRHYHNLYATIRPTNKWLVIAGFDIGFQDRLGDKKKENWFSPVLITSYAIGKRVKLAARGEYFADKDNIIINPLWIPPVPGFKTWGISGNLDIQVLKDCMFRFEYRLLQSRNLIYNSDEGAVKDNRSIAFALLFWLE